MSIPTNRMLFSSRTESCLGVLGLLVENIITFEKGDFSMLIDKKGIKVRMKCKFLFSFELVQMSCITSPTATALIIDFVLNLYWYF